MHNPNETPRPPKISPYPKRGSGPRAPCSRPIICTACVFIIVTAFIIYILSLHDALPIWLAVTRLHGQQRYFIVDRSRRPDRIGTEKARVRSEEHTSELQSPVHIVCRLLLEKKKLQAKRYPHTQPKTQPQINA